MYGFHSFYFGFLLFYVFYVVFITYIFKNKRRSLQYIIFLFIPLFLLSALRNDTVGGDLRNYIPDFYSTDRAKSLDDLITHYEPGYSILVKLITLISSDTRAYLIVTSFCSLIGPLFLIYKYSNSYSWSVIAFYMMGFYTNTFNIIRQSIAVSIFFLSIPFLLNKKAIAYYLLAFLAISMHYSAIALLFIYPVVQREIKLRTLLFIIFSAILIYFLLGSSLIYTLISLLFTKYNPDTLLESHSNTGWNLLILYFFFFGLFLISYYMKGFYLENKERAILRTLVYFQLFATLFQLFASLYSTIMRMGLYFFIPTIVSLPLFCSLYKRPFFQNLILIITLSAYLFFFYRTYSYDEGVGSNGQGVIPYIFLNNK